MVTEEKPLFSWLAVNAVFLSPLGLFLREGWDHKPSSKGNSSACIPARVLVADPHWHDPPEKPISELARPIFLSLPALLQDNSFLNRLQKRSEL